MAARRPGQRFDLNDLGMGGFKVTRRNAMKAGIGAAAGAGVASALGGPPAYAGLNKLARANAVRVGGDAPTKADGSLVNEQDYYKSQLTGPKLTAAWGTPYTDLCIPVYTGPADGSGNSLLFVGGDSYGGTTGPAAGPWYNPGDLNDWRSPVGLLSRSTDAGGKAVIDGAITDRAGHAKALVAVQNHTQTGPRPGIDNPKDPLKNQTELPTDVFRVGNTLYMHTAFGVYGRGPDYTAFYNSTDFGQTWNYLRRWPDAREYGNQFQQKTYAVANDDYVYCLTTTFQRETVSGLLLFRVRKTDLNVNDDFCNKSGYGARYGYQAWGYANGRWAWGNLPTSIIEPRTWGEICFRAMGGKYVLSWLQTNIAPNNPNRNDLRAMVFPFPTSDLVNTTEQTMVYTSTDNPASGGLYSRSVQFNPYGPFIFPGSTFNNFNFVVSNWDPTPVDKGGPGYTAEAHNYRVAQWKTALNENI